MAKLLPDGERSGIGLALVGLSREGAYRNGKRIHVSKRGHTQQGDDLHNRHWTKKDPAMRAKLRLLSDMARNGRSIGGFWQHMLVAEGATEVAVDLTSQPWILPRWELSWRRRGPLDESAWREDDLFGAAGQHERKDSRRGAEDSGVRWRHGRPHTS